MQRRPAISTDKCPSNPRRNPQTPKVLTFFTHDLTISYLAQAAGLEPTTHGFGDRRSTHIELRLCMPLLEKEPFLFFAEFLEDHYVEPSKMVFFIFAGVGGTQTGFQKLPIPPKVSNWRGSARKDAGQSREGVDLHSKLYMISRYIHAGYHIYPEINR